MAKLPPPPSTSNPFADQIGDGLAPTGTFVATILDIKDEFGVRRRRYESIEMEEVDLTCFLFGFRDQHGAEHRIASKRMKISGHENSALFGFLKGLLGKAPEIDWDYCDRKGSQCLITIEHVQRKDGSGVYASICSVSPLPPGYGNAQAVIQPSVAPMTGEACVAAPQATPPADAPSEGAIPSGSPAAQPALTPASSPVPADQSVVAQTPAPANQPESEEVPF